MSEGALRLRRRNLIAERRRALGLSQRELADRVGVSHPTIVRWELGQHQPSEAMVGKLAQALRCRPNQLFPHDFV